MDLSAKIRAGTLLSVDKPCGWTSFDVVNLVKGRFRCKVGHSGTLDPMATGLLVLGTQKFTKKLSVVQDQEKEYTGEITLGASTPSYDAETEPTQHYSTGHIDGSLIRTTAEKFTGQLSQIPPMYSALKHKGERLYKIARKGNTVERPPRQIEIKKFLITDISLPSFKFLIICSKGTYIRSIAHDFGQELNSGAYLSVLRRTRVGDFSVEDSASIDDLKKAAPISQ